MMIPPSFGKLVDQEKAEIINDCICVTAKNNNVEVDSFYQKRQGCVILKSMSVAFIGF